MGNNYICIWFFVLTEILLIINRKMFGGCSNLTFRESEKIFYIYIYI